MEQSFTKMKKNGNESIGKSCRNMGSSNNECLIANNSEQPVMEPEEQGEEETFPHKEYLLKSQVVKEPPDIVTAPKHTQMTTATRNVQDSIGDTVPSFKTIEEAGKCALKHQSREDFVFPNKTKGWKEKKKESSSITNGKKRTQTVSDEEPLSTEPHSQVSSAIQEKSNIPLKRKMEESSPATNEGKVNIKKKIKKSSSITNGKKPIPILSDKEPTPIVPDEESTPIVSDEEPLINQSQSQLSLQSSSAISSGTTAPVKPNVPDHLERKELYQLERNKQLLEYRYQQKEMIENLISIVSDGFGTEKSMFNHIAHMLKCPLLTKNGRLLFGKNKCSEHCYTDVIVKLLNNHFDENGKQSQDQLWAVMMFSHCNKCDRSDDCRVQLCPSFKDIVREMIPNWIFEIGDGGKSMKSMLSIDFIYGLGRGTFNDVYHVLSKTSSNGAVSYVSYVIRKQRKKIKMPFYVENISRITSDYIMTPYFNHPLCPMQFADISLHDYSTRLHGLSSEGCLRILRDILFGLKHLHGLDLVHRDVKPANVVLCWYGNTFQRAKLCDLDTLHPANVMGTGAGSYGFAGPEVTPKKKRLVLTASDMFSFGRSLYQMRTGKSVGRKSDVKFLTNDEMSTDLRKNYDDAGRAFQLLIILFACCTQDVPSDRPSAEKVVDLLEGCKDLWEDYAFALPWETAIQAASSKDVVRGPSDIPNSIFSNGVSQDKLEEKEILKKKLKEYIRKTLDLLIKPYGEPNPEELSVIFSTYEEIRARSAFDTEL